MICSRKHLFIYFSLLLAIAFCVRMPLTQAKLLESLLLSICTFRFRRFFYNQTKIALPLLFVNCYSHTLSTFLHTCTKTGYLSPQYYCRYREKQKNRKNITKAKKSCHNIKMHVSTDKDVRIFFHHPENGRKHPLEIASDIASKILLPKIVYFIRAALYSASRMPNIEEKNSNQMA